MDIKVGDYITNIHTRETYKVEGIYKSIGKVDLVSVFDGEAITVLMDSVVLNSYISTATGRRVGNGVNVVKDGIIIHNIPQEVRSEFIDAITPSQVPQCTCDSKLLFDEGCQCQYAKWKASNKK